MGTTSEWNRRLAGLVESFRHPERLSREIEYVASDEFDEKMLWKAIATAPIRDRRLVQQASARSGAGLAAAKKGRYTLAGQFLEESARAAQDLDPGTIPRLYFQSVHHAAIAYLRYRQGAFAEAIAELVIANDHDLALIFEHGLSYRHLHRVHLVHNRARVEAKDGRVFEALALTGQLLDHLHGADAIDLPVPGRWDSALLEACPIEAVAATIHRLGSDRDRWTASSPRGGDGLSSPIGPPLGPAPTRIE